MLRTQVINEYIRRYGYKTYLEIGCCKGFNFTRISIPEKHTVDPDPNTSPTFRMTSDEFFEQNTSKYDIIFIDGLHHSEQVYKDIMNSLQVLNENGTILCHDMNPTNELIQRVPRETKQWTGDCWKAFVRMRKETNNLQMFVIDTDYGIGVIRRSASPVVPLKVNLNNLTYDMLDKNRKKWLNLVSVESAIPVK